ncbi:MAG: TraE/TraK family type IV conjugative transfer system protein [Aliarcobacter sp.]|nr:TraE/TraK family type IV conjugative transfer system protein [Aliarcobacter sp.]
MINKKSSINLFNNKQKNRLFKERLSLKKFFVFNTIFVATILAVANVVLVTSLVYVVLTKKIYMQPPFLLKDTMELDYKNGILYEETLNNFAEFFISLSENLTPENAEKRVTRLKSVLDTNFYKEFAPVLDRRVQELKANNMTRSFYISNIDTTTYGTLIIKGLRTKAIGQNILQSQKIEMVITYVSDSGITIKKLEEN